MDSISSRRKRSSDEAMSGENLNRQVAGLVVVLVPAGANCGGVVPIHQPQQRCAVHRGPRRTRCADLCCESQPRSREKLGSCSLSSQWEPAMSTMSLGTLSSGPSFWSQVQKCFKEWHRRFNSRWELATLDQRSLRDVGLSASSADYEASKPFWTA